LSCVVWPSDLVDWTEYFNLVDLLIKLVEYIDFPFALFDLISDISLYIINTKIKFFTVNFLIMLCYDIVLFSSTTSNIIAAPLISNIIPAPLI
jgi:hypothetical protein